MREQRSHAQGLRIRVVDPDNDYLGIEICAESRRFAGTARIYAGLSQLSEFANRIMGFPADPHDERTYEFGSRDPSAAGGYCKLHFQCIDRAGHAAVAITIGDDDRLCPPGRAELILPIIPAGLDRFVALLPEIEQKQSGEAVLVAAQELESLHAWWRKLSTPGGIRGIKNHPRASKGDNGEGKS